MIDSMLTPGPDNRLQPACFTGVRPCADPCVCELKVEGTGRIKVKPDIAIVNLGVVTENLQLGTAQAENTARMTAVIGTLNGMGVSPADIQTSSYNITPQYDYIEGKQVFRGYRVEHMLKVTMRDMARIGSTIDAAVQSGANQIGSIAFAVEDPSPYYRQALDAAVDDALAKAATIAVKLNIRVIRVPVRVVELGYVQGAPIPLAFQTAAASTPIQSGQIEITAQIEAVFAYWR
ncbi:MAG TPA: SIMPL domain-containing protein [Clostridia bacterium]|nr:SIMPL domain-containing protein [Clostridia bacterium]